jgi:hypothetical protein
MKNDKSLIQKHTNAFWLAMGNYMVLKVTVCMIKPHIDFFMNRNVIFHEKALFPTPFMEISKSLPPP